MCTHFAPFFTLYRCKFFSLTETPEDYTIIVDEDGFKGTFSEEKIPPISPHLDTLAMFDHILLNQPRFHYGFNRGQAVCTFGFVVE